MNAIDNQPIPQDRVPGRTTLDEAPVRALIFLRAVGTSRAARAALEPYGFTAKTQEEGWALLHKACHADGGGHDPIESKEVGARVDRIKSWVKRGFRLARAALHWNHGAQEAFLLGGITPAVNEVVALSLFLDRCDALERGIDRANTRAADDAALAILEARGVSKSERAELRALVKEVQSGGANEAAPAPEAADLRAANLLALYAWVQGWSETARTVVTHRAILIKMGFAKRRMKGARVEEATRIERRLDACTLP